MTSYTHHGWKKLEGNHFQKHLGKISFALPGFDQNLQLRCLWYCDTRRQWQAFKNIFDVIASLIGSSLCIFEINCLVVFWSGGPPEQTGDKSHKTTMSGSQESFRVPASHFRAGKTPKDNISNEISPKKVSIFHLSNATHRRRESIHCFCLSGVLFDVVT